ncbi:MAG TPA: glutaredoxin family protein [Casimicrobiaceae bacterium]|nr:glutaredoxin family protein [Casimicrobiaceae bacterium]
MGTIETDPRRLTLLVRAYCHLCDDMREALAPLAARFGWAIEEIDIDADAVLEKRWGDSVPVLLAGQRELCRHRMDAATVTAFLVDTRANSR